VGSLNNDLRSPSWTGAQRRARGARRGGPASAISRGRGCVQGRDAL